MPTKQAYLAIHQTAQLAMALKYNKVKEINKAKESRRKRMLAERAKRVLGSS